MPPKKRARREPPKAAPAPCIPASIGSLDNDQLLTIFSLAGNPAVLSQVCKAWKTMLEGPSEVWRDVVLYGCPADNATGPAAHPCTDHGGILQWLLPRRSCIESVTFIRCRARPDHNHARNTPKCHLLHDACTLIIYRARQSCIGTCAAERLRLTCISCFQTQQAPPNSDGSHFLPLFSTAAGLLSTTPLRALRFQDCNLSPQLLPQLRLLTNLTALRLDAVATVIVDFNQLDQMFKALPLLEELHVKWTPGRNITHAWPESVCSCTRLRQLAFTDAIPTTTQRTMPEAISRLTALESLVTIDCCVNELPHAISTLGALSLLQLKRAPGARLSLVLPPQAAGLSSLQRLSIVSVDVPAHLTALSALSRLSIGSLVWTAEAGTQVAGLTVLSKIQALRLHHCSGLYKTWSGLFTVLNGLPALKHVGLDHNGMTHCSLGHCARQLATIDLRGSAFAAEEGIPGALRRALACRRLKLTLKSLDVLTLGGTQSMSASPLMGMTRLQQLHFYQPMWVHEDVAAAAALQRAFLEAAYDRGCACSGCGPQLLFHTTRDCYQTANRVAGDSSDEEGY